MLLLLLHDDGDALRPTPLTLTPLPAPPRLAASLDTYTAPRLGRHANGGAAGHKRS